MPAISAVLAIAGCAVYPSDTAIPPASRGERWAQREQLLDACMKERGLRYVRTGSMSTEESEEEKRASRGEYAAMLAERRTYGLKISAGFLYPDDPKAGGRATLRALLPVDHNYRLRSSLSPAQGKAYDRAHDDCYADVVKRLTGKTVRGAVDYGTRYGQQHEAELARELDADPRLVALAWNYADCMRAKGYNITTSRPTEISTQVSALVVDDLDRIARKQRPDFPAGEKYLPHLTAEQAKPYFARERAIALDDLECGKDFFPVYLPRSLAIGERVEREWGL